jgi:hypothetical protein
MFGNWKSHVSNTLNTFIVFMFSAVIDSFYILLVVFFNVGIDWFVNFLKPVGLAYWTFVITQILLGILSLYNIAVYVYSDMRIVYIRSKKMIAAAQERAEE